MTKKVPPGGQKMNFSKNQLREVNQRAMPIGKMVSLLILPFGNPKSARGRHPYLRKLFPFVFCAITFQPIIVRPQNDRQKLSFVKDEHTYGKKMARKCCTKVIYKGAFVCIQTLFS